MSVSTYKHVTHFYTVISVSTYKHVTHFYCLCLQGRREPTWESGSIEGKLGGKPVENDRKAPEMGVGDEALGET